MRQVAGAVVANPPAHRKTGAARNHSIIAERAMTANIGEGHSVADQEAGDHPRLRRPELRDVARSYQPATRVENEPEEHVTWRVGATPLWAVREPIRRAWPCLPCCR